MKVIKNKAGNYLPETDKDIPMFRHIFHGALEVTEKQFEEGEYLFFSHGIVSLCVIDESLTPLVKKEGE